MIKLDIQKFDEVTFEVIITNDGVTIGKAYTIVQEDEEVYVEDIDIYEEYRNNGFGTQVFQLLADEYEFIFFAPTDENNQRLYERIAEEYTVNTPEVDQGFGVYYID